MFSRGLLVVSIAALTACGGGGGGGGSTTPTPPVGSTNNAPVISSSGQATVLEGSTSVITLSASDADGDSLTYSLDGADGGLFTLSGQDIVFTQAPNFESPESATQSNTYVITAKVGDGTVTVDQDITVNVADAFEGRVIDGPVRDAKVYVQCSDGVTDNGEIMTQSDSEGGYFLSKVCPEGFTAQSLVSIGGVDTTTNKELTNLALRADIPTDASKSSYITPVSTLIASQATPALKQAVVDSFEFLGSEAGSFSYEDLLAIDPWSGAQADDDLATDMQVTNLLLGAILQTAAQLVAGSSADQEASALLVSSLISNEIIGLDEESEDDLFTPGGLLALLSDVLIGFEESGIDPNFSADLYSGVASNAASSLATVMQQLGDVVDPTSSGVVTVIATLQSFLGNDIDTAVDAIGQAVATGVTGSELDALIADLDLILAAVVETVNQNIVVVEIDNGETDNGAGTGEGGDGGTDNGTGTDAGTGTDTGTDTGTGTDTSTETEIIYEGFTLPKSIKVLETVE